MFGLGLKSRLRKAGGLIKENATRLFRPRLVMKGQKENIAVVFSEPHDMPIGDRIVLYALIRGIKPASYLEIGVRWGGSARIVASAMQANGFGRAVGLDPDLSNFKPRTSELFGRFSMVQGYSPEGTENAVSLLGGPVEFVFIDAVHTYSAVKADLQGILPHLSEDAHILFHDAFHQGINQAVDEFLVEQDGFSDFGIVSRNAEVGLPVSYAGLRLIKKGQTEFYSLLSDAHNRSEKSILVPSLSSDTWDFDPYANRVGNPLGRPENERQ